MLKKFKEGARRLWKRWELPRYAICLALPLLVFWFLIAVGLFFLSLGLLRLLGVQTADKEAITLVGTLVAAAIGFAVQQWNTLDQAEKERRDRRQRALGEIEELREALRSRDYARALSLYRVFRERVAQGGTWQDLEVEQALETVWEIAPAPLRLWMGWRAEASEPEISRESLEALVWAWRLGDGKVAREKVEKLISAETLCQVVAALGNDPVGVPILRSPVIGERLDALNKEALPPEQKKCLDHLVTLRQHPVRLPPPWYGVRRPPDPREIRESLKRLGLDGNPFGPEQAELDPRLKDYGVWPRSLDQARGPQPALVFGPSGCGKTAAALLLMYKCLYPPANPDEGAVFPVWLEPPLETWPETASGWLDLLGRAVAEALLQAGALDPYALFEQEAGAAAAIALLLLRVFGAEGLEHHLRRMGLQEDARYYVLGQVRELAGEPTPESVLDGYVSLDLVGRARPAGLSYTYVFLDLPSTPHYESPSTVGPSLAHLLEMALPLASRGVYIKAFLLDQLQESLAGHWFKRPIALAWQEDDLREMLFRRLTEMAQLENLQQIFDKRARVPDPDDQLIQAAGGSPRELVRLGNQMLAGARGERLTPEDLPQVR